MSSFIYLASQSPRRRQLLDQLGVKHELLLPGADEDAESLEAERAGEAPLDYVQRVTRAKLKAAKARLAARGLDTAPILCADTTVAIGRRILAKPADRDDAIAMLGALSGRTHRVMTAVSVAGPKRSFHAVNVSTVRFSALPPSVIERYVDSGEPFGKAGGYAIQSVIAGWIPEVRGSYSAIMGLPLFETATLLRQAGVHGL